MNRRRFLLRPSYQRGEAINTIKSSAIIESILLGIKLPPLFVYKRNDGISEVVDGQQRLLSILGFIEQEFLDENSEFLKSEKNGFALKKLTILDELNGKRYKDLDDTLVERILDFNLSVVNIDERINPHFDPIDLFIRLNNKPYPLRENTFEMWNSYVDKEIISTIKNNMNKHGEWFHSRLNNKRMENEEMYATISYLEYKSNLGEITSVLDIYQRGNKINSRIKDKADITKLLNLVSTDEIVKAEFLKSIKSVESFVRKVKWILLDQDVGELSPFLKGELDQLFNPKGHKSSRRTLQNFYALWYILYNINSEMIKINRTKIKKDIKKLYEFTKNVPVEFTNGEGLTVYRERVRLLWDSYKVQSRKISLTEDEKRELIKRQKNICPLCNGFLFIGDEIEIDHIKPLAIGGRDSFLNLQATHKECNRKKKVSFQ